MNQTYIKFFQELAKTTATTAESVVALDHAKHDEQGEKTATTMRDDYNNLYDKLTKANLQTSDISRSDFAKLLVGALITSSQLQDRIKQYDKVLHGYKVEVIPKLERIINETKDDSTAQALAEEIFQIIENSNEEKNN